MFISQHLLQPSIIASGLWLIRENLKGTVFVRGKPRCVVTRCTTRCTTRCHSIPLVCLFINDRDPKTKFAFQEKSTKTVYKRGKNLKDILSP